MGRFFLSVILAIWFAAAADAQAKRAFIVGVGDYDQLPDLEKTLGDADGYTDVFTNDLGFDVTHLKDPGHIEFLEAFDGFVKTISPGDQVAFIFSGHGWSDGADNYLAMTDAPQVASEFALSKQTVSLAGDIMGQVRARNPDLVFAVIDACRDNPFDTGTRTMTRGLVRMEQVPGTLVVYAAGARQKALDRLGPDDTSNFSVFTRSLLPKLKDPKMPLMRAVEDAKNETTELAQTINHRQRPAVYTDVSIDYCFAGDDCNTNVTVDIDEETSDWVHISSAGYGTVHPCEKYQNYLNKWSEDGKFAETARSNLTKHNCRAAHELSWLDQPIAIKMEPTEAYARLHTRTEIILFRDAVLSRNLDIAGNINNPTWIDLGAYTERYPKETSILFFGRPSRGDIMILDQPLGLITGNPRGLISHEPWGLLLDEPLGLIIDEPLGQTPSKMMNVEVAYRTERLTHIEYDAIIRRIELPSCAKNGKAEDCLNQ